MRVGFGGGNGRETEEGGFNGRNSKMRKRRRRRRGGLGEGGEFGFGHGELEVPVDFSAHSCEHRTDQGLREWSLS